MPAPPTDSPNAFDGRAIASRRRSVISSMAQRTPFRPSPESFTPPYGIASSRHVGASSTISAPTSSARNASWMCPASRVSQASNPSREAFTAAIASEKCSYSSTATTGPKISSSRIFIGECVTVKTVGRTIGPFRFPPASRVPSRCSVRAPSIQFLLRENSRLSSPYPTSSVTQQCIDWKQ